MIDSVLVVRLMLFKQRWMETRELSSVGGVAAQATVSRGQSIRVKSMILRKSIEPNENTERFLAPYIPHEGDAAWIGPVRPAAEIRAGAVADGTVVTSASRAKVVGFQGATVVEPKRGYYNVPIPTLDFEGVCNYSFHQFSH